jgi:hypothetical protein
MINPILNVVRNLAIHSNKLRNKEKDNKKRNKKIFGNNLKDSYVVGVEIIYNKFNKKKQILIIKVV